MVFRKPSGPHWPRRANGVLRRGDDLAQPGDLITGKYGLNELSGPIGVVDAIGDAALPTDPVQTGGIQIQWDSLLLMIVMITVNVGIFNLLPLPALDGED